jgi:hypothetical protein
MQTINRALKILKVFYGAGMILQTGTATVFEYLENMYNFRIAKQLSHSNEI